MVKKITTFNLGGERRKKKEKGGFKGGGVQN
jgi:hypothetical protein